MKAEDAIVEIVTNMGTVKVKLYDDTPLHKANFLKLAEEGAYDGMLFHRVINDFMVQTGDPYSKEENPTMPLGSGQIGEDIKAEIVYPKHYHKYGALAAARDGNPEKKSSGSQFYIVTGRKVDAKTIEEELRYKLSQPMIEQWISENRAELDSIAAAGGRDAVYAKIGEIAEKAATEVTDLPMNIVEDYSTIGGTPHLDGDYTVFGEVIEGMDVIDNIQKVKTDRQDRPIEDIRIISTKVLSK